MGFVARQLNYTFRGQEIDLRPFYFTKCVVPLPLRRDAGAEDAETKQVWTGHAD